VERYNNRDGDSNIVAFDIGNGSIAIEFIGGDRYLYTNQSAGEYNVAKMQELARTGSGLSNFIIQAVGEAYACKLDIVGSSGTSSRTRSSGANAGPGHSEEASSQESSEDESEKLTPMQAQEEIRQLHGMLVWEGDLDSMRADK
jgi:hypothetical protein